jgi:nicotinamidase-related amidase
MHTNLILLDIESQRDFFLPTGSCYTEAADRRRGNLYRLFDWARKTRRPVISTVLRVPPGQVGPLGEAPHCIEGTPGERKLHKTLLRPYVNLGLQNTTDLPEDLFRRYRQVIFEKRHTDIFAHARIERLITELPRCTFVLCGAGAAGGVVQAAVGLRNRGFSVVLATDAVLCLQHPQARMALRRMLAKGVLFVKTREIVRPVKRPVHIVPFRSLTGAHR